MILYYFINIFFIEELNLLILTFQIKNMMGSRDHKNVITCQKCYDALILYRFDNIMVGYQIIYIIPTTSIVYRTISWLIKY